MFPVFQPSPHINIPIYLVVMSLACTLSIIYFYKRAFKLNLPPKLSTEISLAVMIGSALGARLFHVIFEYPEYYLNSPIEIFKFYNGGFVYYGGMFGGLLTSYWYIKKIRQNYFGWLDCAAPVLSMGYIVGRIGCIFAGCCFGKECTLPWAIRFPEGVEAPANIPLHPTQVYSILLEMIVWSILIFVEKKKPLKTGSLFFTWVFFHAIGRIIVEQFRGDFRGETVFGLSISSIISLALIISSALWLYRKNSRDNSKNLVK